MPGANQDANYSDEVNHLVGAPSASEEATPKVEHENLNLLSEQGSVNTVDDDTIKPASSSDADDKGAVKGEEDNKALEGAEKAKEGKEEPFHKHPDWQRMMKERNESQEAVKRLEAQLELLTKTLVTGKEGGKEAPEAVQPEFKDLTGMADDEIAEWIQDKPKEFAANLYRQIRHELMNEFDEAKKEKEAKSGVEQTMSEFAKAHPDFTEMFGKDGGPILDYVKEHPGHNFISAYHALTEEKRLNDAMTKAREEGKKQAEADFKAKRGAGTVLGSGSPVTPKSADDRLQDSSKHGGVISTLVQNLMDRRRAVN